MIQEVVVPIAVLLILLAGLRFITQLISDYFFHRTLREAMRHDKESVPKLLDAIDARREDTGIIGWLLIAFAAAMGSLGLFEPVNFRGAIALALFPALLGVTFLAYRRYAKRKNEVDG